METLTLDTNVLRDWAWTEGKTEETRYNHDPNKQNNMKKLFSKLKNIRDASACEIGITNQIYKDFEKDWGKLPSFIDEMIGSHVTYALPSISTFPMIFPFVFVDEKEINCILTDVFPNTKPEHKKYKKNKKDALQLYAHRMANRDIFLTSDGNILSARQILFSKWQIRVMTLDEYIGNQVCRLD